MEILLLLDEHQKLVSTIVPEQKESLVCGDIVHGRKYLMQNL